MIPHFLAPFVKREGVGRDWAALLIDTTIYISMHIVEHLVPGGRAEIALHEAYEFITSCNDQYNGRQSLYYIIGMDANTSLRYSPDSVSTVVGPGVLQARASHLPSWSSWICEYLQSPL